MEWKELFVELMELVRGSSAIVWETARRQAMVQGVQGLFGAAIVAICGAAILFLMKKTWSNMQHEVKTDKYTPNWECADSFPLFCLLGCCGLACFFLIGVFLSGSISRFINPDFYAIKVLVALVTPG